MTAYFILTDDIDDEDTDRDVPGAAATVGGTIAEHGGRILAVDHDADFAVGERRDRVVLLEFPSANAVRAWLDDEEYGAAKAVRLASRSTATQIIAAGRG